ncbi:SDR family oxidoreductase [Sphingomonas sp. TDK1]|uniref:SDR family oxidoreductase n=1 Tax=Sphingomonas sp. TDK1 TaxID=453247 RepID=UPI0007D98747|nr:SDR family NAD(P)-dependent oxidoreductase [Sphingomonas sp. TDK1]OAN66664.1 oxidoreductase [Sphingomonas sp. TDK1]
MQEQSPLAVITGAASGIGAGLAREAARRGVRLLLADRDQDRLRAVAGELPDAESLAVDVTDPAAVDALAARAAAMGGADLLFNNAGVMTTGLSWEIPADAWDRAMAINIGGVLNGLRSFVPQMIARGTACRIINTASVGGFLPSPLMAPYSVTKFGVVALTESLKLELAMLGAPVAVSLLAPGPVHSEIFADPFAGAVQPATEQFVAAMRDLLRVNGIDADTFAARVFDAIERGDYWIIPQPEALDPALDARHAMIRDRRAPDLSMLG